MRACPNIALHNVRSELTMVSFTRTLPLYTLSEVTTTCDLDTIHLGPGSESGWLLLDK